MHQVSGSAHAARRRLLPLIAGVVVALTGCSAAPLATSGAYERAASVGEALSRAAADAAAAETGTAIEAPAQRPTASPTSSVAGSKQAKKQASDAKASKRLGSTPAPTASPLTGSVEVRDGTGATPANSGTGRRIIYSISQQRVWLVEAGERVVRTYRVSGRLDQPGPGTFSVFSKSRNATSAVAPPATMRYMVRFTKGKRGANIGFHDIPRYMSNGKPEQTEAQLGQPLSAGCIRQRTSDAIALWNFAPVGTKVVVTR